jgi:diguanylate cyclase (GGDEF)-like protein
MSSALLGPALALFALALSLSLRRHRAAQILLVLMLAGTALLGTPLLDDDPASRGSEAVTMFAPWLLLIAAAVPEPPLRSRRMAGFVLLTLIAIWLTMAAPPHVWDALLRNLPFNPGATRPSRAAAWMTTLAAALALLRWLMRGSPLDFGLSIALGAAALGFVAAIGGGLGSWLGVASCIALVSVVYATYRMALLDALTGLPNRRALDEALSRQSGAYSVAMVDVDHFKLFNDTHGHDAGDRVLVAVARSLAHTPRADAYRFGGEEFCLLFRHPDDAAASCEIARSRVEGLNVALPRKRAKAGTKAPVEKTKSVQVTVSIGVARREPGRDLPDEALKRADQALYKAKGKGRNQVVLDKMRA